jgi:ABC-type nitrate/sulfonate/bicarbonate transport system substrate-binding protein
MREHGWTPQDLNPKAVAKAIAAFSDTPLRVGVPFPYSMHRLLLDYLIEDDAPDVSKALTFVTTPPPLMAAAVAAGELDLFCVGEPWGTVAVTSGVAERLSPRKRRDLWKWVFTGPIRSQHSAGSEQHAARALKDAIAANPADADRLRKEAEIMGVK